MYDKKKFKRVFFIPETDYAQAKKNVSKLQDKFRLSGGMQVLYADTEEALETVIALSRPYADIFKDATKREALNSFGQTPKLFQSLSAISDEIQNVVLVASPDILNDILGSSKRRGYNLATLSDKKGQVRVYNGDWESLNKYKKPYDQLTFTL